MKSAHFIAVTPNEVGPIGLLRKMFAAGFETSQEALDVAAARLNPGETAQWLDHRSLAIRPGEVRAL